MKFQNYLWSSDLFILIPKTPSSPRPTIFPNGSGKGDYFRKPWKATFFYALIWNLSWESCLVAEGTGHVWQAWGGLASGSKCSFRASRLFSQCSPGLRKYAIGEQEPYLLHPCFPPSSQHSPWCIVGGQYVYCRMNELVNSNKWMGGWWRTDGTEGESAVGSKLSMSGFSSSS